VLPRLRLAGPLAAWFRGLVPAKYGRTLIAGGPPAPPVTPELRLARWRAERARRPASGPVAQTVDAGPPAISHARPQTDVRHTADLFRVREPRRSPARRRAAWPLIDYDGAIWQRHRSRQSFPQACSTACRTRYFRAPARGCSGLYKH